MQWQPFLKWNLSRKWGWRKTVICIWSLCTSMHSHTRCVYRCAAPMALSQAEHPKTVPDLCRSIELKKVWCCNEHTLSQEVRVQSPRFSFWQGWNLQPSCLGVLSQCCSPTTSLESNARTIRKGRSVVAVTAQIQFNPLEKTLVFVWKKTHTVPVCKEITEVSNKRQSNWPVQYLRNSPSYSVLSPSI